MRSTWYLALVAFVVLAGSTRFSVSGASKSRPRPPQVTAERAVLPGEEVNGFGRNAADARENALDHAKEKVRELLKRRFDSPDWDLPPARLDTDLLGRYGVIKEEGEPRVDERFKEERWLIAKYTVRLTPEFVDEMSRILRQEKVHSRHLLAARILAGLVAVLLVTAGYLRLEDMTRGYATKLLRLAAAAILALVGAGLWWTW